MMTSDKRDDLIEKVSGKDYILMALSSFNVGKNASIELLDEMWEELLEARFFDEDSLVHIYEFEGERKIACFQEEPEEKKDSFDERQLLRDQRYNLLVRKYIEYDEYGQAFISMVRPVRLEEKGNEEVAV